MKYGVWNVTEPKMDAVNTLVGSGYAPLVSMVLASRGIGDERKARAYLDCNAMLHDPYMMTDMAAAAGRVALALEKGERIAVFGDYDVDGITATCLLTEFLRSMGGDCVPYIPGRLEEGYGLNALAINQLHAEGVSLIVTVDCGITAVEEAAFCRSLGIDLVITDHHECKDELPDAVAVVDPHRPDGGYPHKTLSGVGVAFKLAAALAGDQQKVLEQYADLVCLGTVADVMLLQGENRVFVDRGLTALRNTNRPGVAALMKESGCEPSLLTAATVGYVLAPRINAAGRMGQIELAVELFLTQDPRKAADAAHALCELNRKRQAVEQEIYRQALEMLPEGEMPEAVVLADENWHQGVVGIVASRIAEEFCCPTFLICLDGEHGKASSRSYGGFNLFGALTTLSPLLESYGGHELAAGFTIARSRIPEFRKAICALSGEHNRGELPGTVLEADCTVSPELLTLPNVESLGALEPCGNGCPKPVLVAQRLVVERMGQVGSGRHLRLRLRNGQYGFNAIYFSATAETASIGLGDMVDIAFTPQVNEYRSERSVQLNIVDIRPSCNEPCSPQLEDYRALRNQALTPGIAGRLLPDRNQLGIVWRYLAANAQPQLQETPVCLCRKIVRWSGIGMDLAMLMTCLDIFEEVALLRTRRTPKYITVTLVPRQDKADLTASATMQRLVAAKESDE